jgi:hypothetical protein
MTKNLPGIITNVMNTLLDEASIVELTDLKRVTQLRVSSFPFCGLRWFLGLPLALNKNKKIPASSAYYFKVGHAVHDVFQKAIPDALKSYPGLKVYNDWQCAKCKTFYRFCTEPTKCKCSSKKFYAHEIEVSHEVVKGAPRVVGHIDTVLSITIDGVEIFIVLDYKTSSLSSVKNWKTKFPYLENAAQIKGYVGILADMGINVHKTAYLVYIPRDNPKKFKAVPVKASVSAQKRILSRYVQEFKAVSTLTKESQLKPIIRNRPCAEGLHPDFPSCKWASICAGPKKDAKILAEATRIFNIVKPQLPVCDGKNPNR